MSSKERTTKTHSQDPQPLWSWWWATEAACCPCCCSSARSTGLATPSPALLPPPLCREASSLSTAAPDTTPERQAAHLSLFPLGFPGRRALHLSHGGEPLPQAWMAVGELGSSLRHGQHSGLSSSSGKRAFLYKNTHNSFSPQLYAERDTITTNKCLWFLHPRETCESQLSSTSQAFWGHAQHGIEEGGIS